MRHDIARTLGKYRHMIVIGIALAALASYFIPLNAVFAGHNNANQAARDSVLKGKSSTNSKSQDPKSSSGSSQTPSSTSNTKKPSSTNDPKTSTGNGNPNTARVPSGNDGPNGAQTGGPDDNGNAGHGNTGTGNTGNFNNGDNEIGNFNNNPPGQTGNFCGNGAGHHYGCILHNPHA